MNTGLLDVARTAGPIILSANEVIVLRVGPVGGHLRVTGKVYAQLPPRVMAAVIAAV